MHPLTPAFLAAAGLLAVAGVAKLSRPAGTSRALRAQGLPARWGLVRALGTAEIAVAVAALLELRGGAALLAVTYAGFTAFVGLALVRGRPLSSCGCFAEPDVPPTPVHLVVTAALAASAAVVGAAAGSGAGLPALLAGPVLPAAAVAVSALLLGGLAFLVLTGVARPAHHHSRLAATDSTVAREGGR
jgi:hypothetical protein